ncbi:MAG: AmmeMemoRadiSam system protein A [Atopobiaceae bacterium]|jgi:AmmeMemoRadiSam system protein A/AmmeMemoRadiSam system protein B|nr:AmmeMemoRadiSam system protein A [Atopobiaceae bacterium]MCH4214844.1 AmmeMemoRadiSam system protein A [Atopobiaceae bacterium]MCH4230090.1 AmmeMemoRadiSam system protein A [Atopobiaceae bacterium]MCH4276966.1 AmmeMemoRadiSam system protein A [Atopobiaceae bacterium]MCI1226914.1 AmmeMemoRadiSam system protein A [Atopobiaceae bacterium]
MAIVAGFAVPHPPLIVPAVGHGRERQIAATVAAYEEVARRIATLSPDTIVISSPHAELYYDYLHVAGGAHASGSMAQFDAPEEHTSVDYDEELVDLSCEKGNVAGVACGTEGERDAGLDHASMVPLHFIQKRYRDFRLLRCGLTCQGPLANYRFGQAVAAAADELGRRVVWVASGDLSHKTREEGPYGYAPEGPEFDRRICEAFRTGDFLALLTFDPGFCERAAECGLRSFQMMAGALDRTPVSAELLSFEDPFGVGYGTAAFTPTGPAGSDASRDFAERYETWHTRDMAARKAAEDPYVSLARASLETWVTERRRIRPTDVLAPDAPAELTQGRAGAFVSLKVAGELRGCIGTTGPTCPTLAEEVCANAISAGTRDPRFPAVTAGELPELVYDVDVLGEPEPVEGPEELDPARYGVIVSAFDGRRGLLLPDLDGVDTVEEQVGIAARKGGIDPDHEDVSLERFQVVRHV